MGKIKWKYNPMRAYSSAIECFQNKDKEISDKPS